VTFIGESGVDLGGLQKIVFQAVNGGTLPIRFYARGKNKFLSFNLQAIQVSSW